VQANSLHNQFSSPNPKTLDIVCIEVFEELEYDIDIKNDAPIIFDCGAHIGVASLFFIQKYPHSRIIAFEPNPSSVVYYKKNLEKFFHTQQVQLHQVALGKQNSFSSLHVTSKPGSLLASAHFVYHGPQVPIHCKKLSEFLNDYDVVDLVKLDIEGAEWDVIDELIESKGLGKINQLIVEFHETKNESGKVDAYIQKMTKCGFIFNVRARKSVTMFECYVVHFVKE
jgi:FkbM family methyltransferase